MFCLFIAKIVEEEPQRMRRKLRGVVGRIEIL